MHSSRMRTGRSLTVCWSLLPGGGLVWGGLVPGGLVQGGCLVWGVPGQGGLVPGGVSGLEGCLVWRGAWSGGVWSLGECLVWDGIQHALRQTPLLTESQTPVKTLPWPNFVAAGNKLQTRKI